MPFVDANDIRVHYDFTGPARAPVLVFSNSLGTDVSMWDPQLPALTKKFRVLRYDTRGHGSTSVTSGPYSFEQLGRDILTLADELRINAFSFCGLSMGGLTGLWLGLNVPRVHKLVLCSTAAKIGNPETWNARIQAVRKGGMKSISQAVIERWFTAPFRQNSPDAVARTKQMVESTPVDGYVACCEALREADFRGSVASIQNPTLVISSTHDSATPPSDGHLLAEKIRGARYVELDAAHLSNIEQQERFTAELAKFLAV